MVAEVGTVLLLSLSSCRTLSARLLQVESDPVWKAWKATEHAQFALLRGEALVHAPPYNDIIVFTGETTCP